MFVNRCDTGAQCIEQAPADFGFIQSPQGLFCVPASFRRIQSVERSEDVIRVGKKKRNLPLRNQGQNVGYPEMAGRHDQHHGGDHISDREFFQLHHPETRCDQEHAATGFEIIDHRLSAERVDRSGKQEKRHENDELLKKVYSSPLST